MATEQSLSEQKSNYSVDYEYLVFASGGQVYALPFMHLVTVIDSPVCTPMPNSPAHVRGVINFHDKSVPLYCCRIKTGLQSHQSEVEAIIDSLKQRKQDHINWINTLKEEVYGDKPITVQTDHHKCAFGMWYDSFSSDDVTLNAFMAEFDKPHQQIHQLAIEVKKMIAEERVEEAKKMIERAENTVLKRLVNLFDDSHTKIKKFSHEYAIVIDYPGQERFAIAVDGLKRFEKFDEVIYPIPSVFSRNSLNFTDAIGRQKLEDGNAEDVLIINLEKFIADDAAKDTGSSSG